MVKFRTLYQSTGGTDLYPQKTGSNRWLCRVDYRDSRGRPTNRKRTVKGSRAEALQVQAELERGIRGNVTTYRQCAELYKADKGARGMESVLQATITALGSRPVDDSFPMHFWAYIDQLKATNSARTGRPLTVTTINRHKAAVRMSINYAVKTGRLKENPIKFFNVEHEDGRDRIWTNEERITIMNTLRDRNSYLYYAVIFASRNPIRSQDLKALTIDNLNLFAGTISFIPKKTGRRKQKKTVLTEWSYNPELVDYFSNLKSDYLFHKENGSPITDFDRHWETICRQAGIEDFHFHDLKHCAITWMLEEGGYTREDLKSLGIQYNDKAIDRYRNYDADRTIERIKLKRNALSDNCRTEAKNGTQNY